ncbi:NUDIX hydrolase [Haloglomus litoreum]|uniref:NUDIX hydrolase n=1 Tax=Haloglomus litoreum TaxID=3034026 RepID=UPI0023E7A47D|nr:CoA pyrophosphatase [Haloglomus sp. DT116]
MDLSRVARHDPVPVTDEEREAGVLVAVVDPGNDAWPHDGAPEDPHVLFIKRQDDLGEHAGQMSFPGGGREDVDPDLEGTALREAREEVGVEPASADVIGRLDDIRTVTRYAVRPYVARVPDAGYEPHDTREVAEVATLAVDDLTDRSNYDSERRDHPHYGDIRLHYFRVDGYVVWGATARMLVQFLELAVGWEMPSEPDREVEADAEFPV